MKYPGSQVTKGGKQASSSLGLLNVPGLGRAALKCADSVLPRRGSLCLYVFVNVQRMAGIRDSRSRDKGIYTSSLRD